MQQCHSYAKHLFFMTNSKVHGCVRAYRSRIGRAGRHYVWHVVWFLLLLFYAPLLHTCAAILKCRSTPSATGREEALVSVIIMISVTSL